MTIGQFGHVIEEAPNSNPLSAVGSRERFSDVYKQLFSKTKYTFYTQHKQYEKFKTLLYDLMTCFGLIYISKFGILRGCSSLHSKHNNLQF